MQCTWFEVSLFMGLIVMRKLVKFDHLLLGFVKAALLRSFSFNEEVLVLYLD